MYTLRITRVLANITMSVLLGSILSGCAPAIIQQTSTEPSPTISASSTELPSTDTPHLPLVASTSLPARTVPVTTPFSDVTLPFQAFPVSEGQVIALVNGRVIDGTGAPAYLDWTVLIQGTRILAVGPDIEIPDGAHIIDLTGKTLLPGMFDMHGHLFSYNGQNQIFESIAYPRLYLAGGVTTIFTAGEMNPEAAIALRENINNGQAIGPQILTTGPYFSGGNAASWMLKAGSPEDMLTLYNQWSPRIDGVKFYTRIPEDQFKTVLDAAHADGLIVTGHLESISGMRAIDLGIDGLEHGLFGMSEFFQKGASFGVQYCAISELDLTSAPVIDIINALVQHGTYLDPTIVVFQPELPNFEPLIEDWEKYLDENARDSIRSAIQSMEQQGECLQIALDKQAQFVKAVHDRGGLIVTGTDPVIPILLPGYSLHRELENLVDAGLTPLEAIQAATLNSAIATLLDSQKGSIALGKIADLIIVDGNPDIDITAIGNTVMVFKNGVPYVPELLRKSVEGLIGRE